MQQRGVAGCRAILDGLLEGMDIQENQPLLIVDAMPNRFLSSLSSVGHPCTLECVANGNKGSMSGVLLRGNFS